ncbi:hypothetical protein EAO77_16775 [Streptomyces sp. t39]|nr:hypothetical protein EAO77_16775 [Streptomyces sp. t39]
MHRLPYEAGEFARYLADLCGRIDRSDGWFAIFWQRDPEGMSACLDGVEIPPWDVVESLLHDLAAVTGAVYAEQESARARALHTAAATAHDLLPGGLEALRERLELMRREESYAKGRARELLRLLAAEPGRGPGAERLTHELAWTRDDHARAMARIAELTSRLERARPPAAPTADPDRPPAPGAAGNAAATTARAAKARRRGGARFAGAEDDDGGAVAVPVLPVAQDLPRGARYGGVPPAPAPAAAPAPDPADAVLAARETVAALGRLRAEGRGGEAHVVLCEAAARPGSWLPALGARLERSGLGADWTTLLWEVASQPAARVAAAADALARAGRHDDGRLLLRQGVARPAGEIADTVMALEDEGMAPRAGALLAAYVEVRSPEDTARVAERDPFRLVPRLLAAARAVSPSRERDLIHALRVAGHLAG